MKTIYCCGPTVYARPHIGNLRAICHADSKRRELKEQVKLVINITDIDDKILDILGIEHFNPDKDLKKIREFTEPIIQQFKEDLQELNVDISKISFVNVSDFLPQMRDYANKLLENNTAYISSDNSSILLRLGIENDEELDFAVWKLDKNRPGWHLECTVMSRLSLGVGFDYHLGGIDLKFPHHYNENLQSVALDTKPLCHCWEHCEHLTVEGDKMSKSLNNFITMEDIYAKGYSGSDLRQLFDSYNYINKLDFTWNKLDKFKTKKADLIMLSSEINNLRSQLRKEGNYNLSDKLRLILENQGLIISDTNV